MLPQSGEANCAMGHSTVVEIQQYIMCRLAGIHTQQEQIITAVNNIAKKAEMSVSLLFQQRNDDQVFFEFPNVVIQLEFYLNQLIYAYHQLQGKHNVVSQQSGSSSTSHNMSVVSASQSDQQMCDIQDLTPYSFNAKVFDDMVYSCNEQLDRVSSYEGGPSYQQMFSSYYVSTDDLNCTDNYHCPYQHQQVRQCEHTLTKWTKLKELHQYVADIDLDMLITPSIDAELKLIINYGHGPELPQMCFKECSMLEVSVAEVINPSSFWLQVHDPQILEMADALMLYNQSLKNCDWGYRLRCEPQQDMNVCARFGETDTWCRARIVSISPAHAHGNIEVFCVDYGKSVITTLDSVRPLHPKFARLPCHSCSCALSQIGPPDGTLVWPSQIANEFREFVRSLPVFIAVMSGHHINSPHLVQLHTVELLSNDTLKDAADLLFNVNGDVAKMMVRNKKANHVNNQFVVNLYKETMNKAAAGVIAKVKEADCYRYSSASSSSKEHTAEVESFLFTKQAHCLRSVDQDGKCPGDTSLHVALQEMTNEQGTYKCVPQSTMQHITSNKQSNTDEVDKNSVDEKHHIYDSLSSSGNNSASGIISSDVCSPTDITTEVDSKNSIQENNPSDQQLAAYKPQEITVPKNGYITFLVSYIQSPSKFWIHVLNQESQEALDKLADELNEYFCKDDKFLLKKYLNVNKIELNCLCCARFQDDNAFYRARIIGLRYAVEDNLYRSKHDSSMTSSSDKEISDVLVQYVDFGNIEWVSIVDVYPLPPRLVEIPPQAVCCTLAGVCPVKPANTAQETVTYRDNEDLMILSNDSCCEWPETAIKVFQKMVGFEQPLVGYVVGVGNYCKISPDTDSPLPLTLVDTSGDDNVYIHEELIRLGHAASTDAVNLSDNQKSDSRILMDFQPSAEDYYSEKNSYFIDVDDPSVVMFGYKPQDEKRICFYYNKSGYCRKGENCRFEHVRTNGLSITDKKTLFEEADLSSYITLPDVDNWVALEVTTVISPAHFYAIFPFGTKPIWQILEDKKLKNEDADDSDYGVLDSLHELNEAMTEKYSSIVRRDTDFTVYAKGTIVACRFTEDDRFYRARVLSSIPDSQMVLVFYVDYGNREWVHESHIRQIIPEYLLLPFQAVECTMPLKPPGTSTTWNSKSDTRFFKEFVEGKTLFAKVLESGSSGCLVVDLYDSTCDDIHINQYLVDNNIAVPSHYPANIISDKRSPIDIQSLQSNTLPG